MTPQQCYDAWAPADSPWSPWVKPVLFALSDSPEMYNQPSQELEVPELPWRQHVSRDAVVVDLPGRASLCIGVALARAGHRPVPLFNGATANNEVVPTVDLGRSLRRATHLISSLRFAPDAPPVFMLDSRRNKPDRSPQPRDFDNRWLTFPQDFPSAHLLRGAGVQGAVVVVADGARLSEDLCHVLRRWEEGGLAIRRLDENAAAPAPISVPKPSLFRSLLYRTLTLIGFRRNSAGGFGSVIPEPSQGGYG